MNTILTLFATRPVVAVHLVAMLTAIPLGVVLLWRRKGTIDHRRLGWLWAALIAIAAGTGMLIQGRTMVRWHGYSPVHLLVLVVAILLPMGLWWIRRGNARAHRRTMTGLYVGACLIAGAFTLLPGRFLGDLVWRQWVGVIA
jgi:uncharacterized membrane protein